MVLAPSNLWVLVASAALILGTQSAVAIDSYSVASFDFSKLGSSDDASTTDALITQLETAGIVSIRNIPFYKQAREQYLKVATECVNSLPAKSSNGGLMHKVLQDGTERFTISTKAQYHNPGIAITSVDCAEYLPKLQVFSALIDEVAVQFAKTLDAASFSASGETDSLETIVKTAEHLDHFHEYTSAATANGATDSEALSLNLHTDNGIMIFMSAPEFYALQEGQAPVNINASTMLSGPTQSAGLLTYLPTTDEVKQPVLERDELVVMIGEGLRAWTTASHNFPAVLHGMKMPTFSSKLGQVVRSWFGKMILMPKDRVIKDSSMTYGEYANKTTDYVVGASDASTFSNSACPPAMELVASDDACSFDVYEPKSDVTDAPFTREDCLRECNFMGNPECQQKCVYVATVPNRGLDCWMLCTPRDVCPVGKEPS
ncbi:hypothetical protein Gpo141_00009565, partial [Globisporangium polare]